MGSFLHCDWFVARFAGDNKHAGGDVKHVLEPAVAGRRSVRGLSWISEGDGSRARTAVYDGRTAVKNITSFWLGWLRTDGHASRWVFLACPSPYRPSSIVWMKVRPFASLYALEYLWPLTNPFL